VSTHRPDRPTQDEDEDYDDATRKAPAAATIRSTARSKSSTMSTAIPDDGTVKVHRTLEPADDSTMRRYNDTVRADDGTIRVRG